MSELSGADSLPNLFDKSEWHRLFDEQFEISQRLGTPLSVIFVDANNFKLVNDELGHHVGDKVIAEIDRAVAQVAGQYLLGGRVGGDEFAVAGEIDEPGAEKIGQQVQGVFEKYLDEPENVKLKELGLSLAIGKATAKDDSTSEDLLRLADEDMYKNKLAQLPELTELQLGVISEARVALAGAGLRLRDVVKYERILESTHPGV